MPDVLAKQGRTELAVVEWEKSLNEWRRSLPADLEEVIMHCLQKDADARYQDAETLEEAFASCACADQWTRRDANQWWRGQTVETGISLAS